MAGHTKNFRAIYAVDCGAICTSNVELEAERIAKLDVKHVEFTVNERQFCCSVFVNYKNLFLFLWFVFLDAKKESIQ